MEVRPLIIELSRHFKERYTERNMGITDVKSRNAFMYEHISDIEKWANKMYQYSTLIYEGTLGDKYPYRKYFRNGEFILVTDEKESILVTMFKVSFGMSEEVNKQISEILTDEIKKLKQDRDAEYDMITSELEEIDNEVVNIDNEIKLMMNKIEALKNNKESLMLRVKSAKATIKNSDMELENMIIRMVGKDFGEYIKKINK